MAVVPVPAGQGGPVDLTKHPSGIVPVLQNIVSTVNLSCKLDLKKIALGARNAEYNPKVAPAPPGAPPLATLLWGNALTQQELERV